MPAKGASVSTERDTDRMIIVSTLRIGTLPGAADEGRYWRPPCHPTGGRSSRRRTPRTRLAPLTEQEDESRDAEGDRKNRANQHGEADDLSAICQRGKPQGDCHDQAHDDAEKADDDSDPLGHGGDAPGSTVD